MLIVGFCELCQQQASLKKSHLIPSAFYKHKTDPDLSQRFACRDKKWRSDKQIQKHLLCGECEQKLNEQGERWIIPQSLQLDGSFPLLNSFNQEAQPLPLPQNMGIPYEANDFQNLVVKKITYFATSVFWRASTRKWGKDLPQLEFGPYKEKLRKFLNDESDWPEGVFLQVTIIKSFDPANRQIIFPLGGRDLSSRAFSFAFYIPGIRFDMYQDQAARCRMDETCLMTSRHHPIFLAGKERLQDLQRAVRIGHN